MNTAPAFPQWPRPFRHAWQVLLLPLLLMVLFLLANVAEEVLSENPYDVHGISVGGFLALFTTLLVIALVELWCLLRGSLYLWKHPGQRFGGYKAAMAVAAIALLVSLHVIVVMVRAPA